MSVHRSVRAVLGVGAALLLVVGCSAGGGTPDGTSSDSRRPGSEAAPPGQDPVARTKPSPRPTAPDYTLRPSRFPTDTAGALRMARRIALEPSKFGPGFTRGEPFEDDPRRWAVLDSRCVWQRAALPPRVLTSLAQHSVLPAQGGKGAVEVVSVISVHRDVDSADQELATTLEEVLRCPRQQLSADEEVTDLISASNPWGKRGQRTTDDQVWEMGTYTDHGTGESTPYVWGTSRLGTITTSVTILGGKGFASGVLEKTMAVSLSELATNVKRELA
ncbi:hypothetical protein ACMA1D_31255 [Streptomyces sp. 796.1]|uniref:hypothetical protein n=1 Tax=Streptomyces sp. 796.1 TaxID=3163029 RepID=UPI0039C9FA22